MVRCGAVRCGAGAGLNIEVCGAVRAPALDDGAVRVRASSLRGGAVAGQTFRPAQASSARPPQYPRHLAEEPPAAANGPWRKKLIHILQGKEGRAPMFLSQMFQTGTDRPLPHRAPLDRATQMECDHVDIQCRINPHITDGAKVRGIVVKRPVRSIPSTPT